MDIAAWLRDLGLEQYEPAFRVNDIDRGVLPTLTSDDLRELGVASLGHRKRLLAAIAALAEPPRAPASDAPPAAQAPAVPAGRAERRQLTVMFVDLVGSSALAARLDPEDMREVLGAYQSAVATAVARFEGHVAKFMGDGVLAYFGWPVAHEDEAERAVRAGLAVVEAVRDIPGAAGEDLAVRIGIATGLVVVGDLVGEGAAQEEAVVGETPNLAARLQQVAAPGTVVIAESTRRLLGGLFALRDLGPQDLHGIGAPVAAFAVVGEAAAESRFEALHRADFGPLVGREQELALMLDRWATAKGGEGQIVLLSGEAGMGKSRLVLELRERLRSEPRFRIGYSCSPHHVNSALWPVASQLERAAGYTRDEPAVSKLDKLERLLRQAGEPTGDAVPLLAELLGLSLDGGRGAPMGSPQERKARVFGMLLAQMEGLARQQPMLVILEDAHWLDPTSAELFDRVADRIRRLPVLLVATCRPERPPPWGSLPHATLLSLNRLGRSASIALIERTTGGRALPPAVAEAILARTEGVPLFVEELTKTILESGLLTAGGDGPLELAGALPPLAIPATLQDSLMARLDRLAPARDVAQIAACIGREFDEEIVAAVACLPPGRLAEALDQLERAELILRHGTPPHHAYSFKHALVRDAAYATLLRARRQQLHAAIAAALERLRPAAAAARPEIVAHHLIEGGAPERAAAYLLAAGRLAKERHAVREATSQLEACLRLVVGTGGEAASTTRETERECLLMLGDLAGIDDHIDRANSCYERAAALADAEAKRAEARNRIHRVRFAERDGARLAFYEHGSGEPAIVFINPIVYGLSTFQPILERLCQEFRVITVDCRGAGRSDPLVRPYSTLQHMEDLRAVVEAAGAAPFVGVGISRGSNLLLQMARAYPGLIGRLMTVGTPIAGVLPDGRSAYDPEYMARRRDLFERGAFEELVELQAHYVYSEPDSDELRRTTAERWQRLPRETALSFYDPDPALDVVPLLESIDVPTLVAHGRDDRLVSYAASEFIASRIPGARLYLFEGKGHNPMFSATEEFCRVLREFARPNVGSTPAGEHAEFLRRDGSAKASADAPLVANIFP